LVVAALLGMAVAVPAHADIFGRNDRYDGYRRGGYRDDRATYRFGFERGYEEGLHHGRRDANKRVDFNFWHDRTYRNADAGYRRDFGPRFEYASGFRSGYEQGYREAYRLGRFGRDGHRGGYNDRYDNDYGRRRSYPDYR
jgi:hypothetical protein